MADVPTIRITAKDEATAVINQVVGSLGGMTSAVAEVGAALGVGFSVAGILEFGKTTIEAAANLDKLSKATGSSVESLSQLTNQAKISGVDVETVSALLYRMSLAMEGVGAGGKLASEALKLLGVTAKDPATAMHDVALALDKFADNSNKAALTLAIFRRSGFEFNAMLHDMATSTEAVATVTEKQAAEAEKLEKSVRALLVGMTDLKNYILSDVVPAMATLTTEFTKARLSGLGIVESFAVALSTGDQQAKMMDTLAKNMASYRSEIEQANKRGDYEWAKKYAGYLDEAGKKLAFLEKLQGDRSLALTVEAAGGRQVATGKKPSAPSLAPIDTSGVDAYTRAIEKLQDEIDKMTGADGGMTHLAQATNEISRLQAAGHGPNQKQIDDWQAWATSADAAAKRQKEFTDEIALAIEDFKLYDEQINAVNRANDQYLKFVQGIDEENKAREFNLSLLGKTADEVAVLTAAYEVERRNAAEADRLEVALNEAVLAGNSKLVDVIRAQQAQLPQLGAARVAAAVAGRQAELDYQNSFAGGWTAAFQSYQKSLSDANIALNLFNDLTRSVENLFVAVANHAKNAWHTFAQSVLLSIEQIGAKMATSGLLSLLTSGGAALFSGSSGASDLASGASAASGLGSLFGAGGLSGIAAGLADSSGLTAAAGNLALAAGATGEAAALIAANVVPIIGTIAVAGYLMYQYLSKARGGPKQGGDFSSGGYSNLSFFPGEDTSAGNAQVKALIDATSASYDKLVKLFGGKGSAVFRQGFDTDPQGTAPNRLHTSAFVGGKSVYDVALGDLGRDAQVLADRMALENKRALIAALKATDLPGTLSKIFAGVTPETITGPLADQLLVFASAYKDLYDVFNANPVDDALTAVADAAKGAQGALEKQGDALLELVKTYDGTGDATTALATATKGYYTNVVTLIAGMEQLKTTIADMFASSIKQYTFAGLDTSGQYNYLRDEAAALTKQLGGTTDSATIDRLTKQIDADMREAFGLLSPAQQAAQSAAFIKSANEINSLAAKQLSDAQQKAQENMNVVLTAIKTAIDNAAATIATGGLDVQEGGQQILTAASVIANAVGGRTLVTG